MALLLLSTAPLAVVAHGEDVTRYLAAHGNDNGACTSAHQPCRTIAYAAGLAGKGNEVRVAEGYYPVDTLEDLFYLQPDAADLVGGYSPDFHRHDPAAHPTLLIGVPAALREGLEARGFAVIVDEKWRGTGTGADPDLLDGYLQTMRRAAGPIPCSDGRAGEYPCRNVGLHAHMPLGAFSSAPSRANDIWGYTDLNTGREYALIGLFNGMAVVDVTDPADPFEIGTIRGPDSSWRDIKTFQYFDHEAGRWRGNAYVSTDGAFSPLVVVDLSGLPNSISRIPATTGETRTHTLNTAGVDFTLNIALPRREPLLVLAGSDISGGAFRAYSLAEDPGAPQFRSAGNRGYMHDGTAMVLRDPAQVAACPNAVGGVCEVLADFNEDTVELWDITDPASPVHLAAASYPEARYVHSGSWSEDGRHLFVHDELAERDLGIPTTVFVFDVTDLLSPSLAATWTGDTAAIDHNGYPRGNRYYMSHYTRGMTVLDVTDPRAGVEVGFFDTFPMSDNTAFSGAWGIYPFLPSGNILISDIQSGLFVLDDGTRTSPPGAIGFGAPSYAAPRGGIAELAVERGTGASGAVSVGWEILHGSTGDDDIAVASGRLDWADGDSDTKLLRLDIPGSATMGLSRFFVRLYDPTGGAVLDRTAITTVFIETPSATPALSFLDQPLVRFDAGQALVTVRRDERASGEVRVDYVTRDGDASAGLNYAAVSGSLHWPDGDATARVIEVPILAAGTERLEFHVELSSPSGATLTTTSVPVGIDARPAAPQPPPQPPPSPPTPPSGGRSGGGDGGWWFLLSAGLLLARRVLQPVHSRGDGSVRVQ